MSELGTAQLKAEGSTGFSQAGNGVCKGAPRGEVTCNTGEAEGRPVRLACRARGEWHRVRQKGRCLVPDEDSPAPTSQEPWTGCLLKHSRGEPRRTEHGQVAKGGR